LNEPADARDGDYHLTSGNSAIERLQAARHSGFVMWVAASQKPMQSLSDLPPPPGLLGADWLGLEGDVAGESARFGEDPPPVANWVGNGSDIGESAGSAGSGAADAAGPVTGVVVGALVAGPAAVAADAAADVLAAVGLARPLALAGALGSAAEAAGVGTVTPGTAAAAAGVLTWALVRPVLLAGASGSAADRPGIGPITLAPEGWPRERMPEPCEPPRASAFAAARHESKRATAGSRCRRGLSVSMLTP
jgi:hypothetical protein